MYTLTGHTDTPTSISLSPNGSFILSPSFSSTVLVHDVRPFSPNPSRIYRSLTGSPAGFESTLLRAAWSHDDGGGRVAVGGADRMLCIWELESAKIMYKVRALSILFVEENTYLYVQLPGHKGTVNCVDFHPKEPIGTSSHTTMLNDR